MKERVPLWGRIGRYCFVCPTIMVLVTLGMVFASLGTPLVQARELRVGLQSIEGASAGMDS